MPHPERDEGRTSQDHEAKEFDAPALIMLGCATVLLFLIGLACAGCIWFGGGSGGDGALLGF
jgi:hypothetical protein